MIESITFNTKERKITVSFFEQIGINTETITETETETVTETITELDEEGNEVTREVEKEVPKEVTRTIETPVYADTPTVRDYPDRASYIADHPDREADWDALEASEYVEPPIVIPQSVTMRQGRLALLGAGMLDAIDGAIAAIEDPAQRKAAEIEWQYASTIDRTSTFTQQMAAGLGLTDEQMDELFTFAATL